MASAWISPLNSATRHFDSWRQRIATGIYIDSLFLASPCFGVASAERFNVKLHSHHQLHDKSSICSTYVHTYIRSSTGVMSSCFVICAGSPFAREKITCRIPRKRQILGRRIDNLHNENMIRRINLCLWRHMESIWAQVAKLNEFGTAELTARAHRGFFPGYPAIVVRTMKSKHISISTQVHSIRVQLYTPLSYSFPTYALLYMYICIYIIQCAFSTLLNLLAVDLIIFRHLRKDKA